MGGEGSGRSRGATDAIERLLAAKFRSDKIDAGRQLTTLASEFKMKRSLISADDLDSLTDQVVAQCGWDVSDAKASPRDALGDVKVDTRDIGTRWIELKSQTKKKFFGDITQADFVRDGTDFLRAYATIEPEFSDLIVDELRLALELDAPMTTAATWQLPVLWMADLGLLVNGKKKKRAGATSPAALNTFLQKKYLLHICMEGARLVRLDNLRPITELLSGGTLHTKLKLTNKGNVASIQVAANRVPAHNTTDFTYHVGYLNAPGRHKLHNAAFNGSIDLMIFRP